MMDFKALALLSAVVASPALASDWQIDPAHTEAGFTVKHMGITNVNGSLGPVSGTIHLDDKDVTKSTVDVSIDVTGIDTREPRRDTHLKSPDFFDVAKFPTATFKSTSVSQVSPGKLKVTGNLTMHGVTKSVTLDVDGPSAPTKDPFGNTKIAAAASGKVDRKDYGLMWNKPLEKGAGFLVGDDVTLNISVEAGPKK
jgi:polyisoprenoid-binding protein YceI